MSDDLVFTLENCLLCGRTNELTAEHIIPAALGGEEIVANGTCLECNGRCSDSFEAEFTNALKVICYVLGIGNRSGKVPSIDAIAHIEGRKFDVVLQPNGKFRLINSQEERVLPSGKKVTEYFLFSDSATKTLEVRAMKRGERLEYRESGGCPIDFEPESFMPLDFIGGQVAMKTATKVAYMALAKVAGRRFACSASFKQVREYLTNGEGRIVRLFVNQNFASNIHIGPHQHLVQICCDGAKHSVFATVTFFGGLSYLVELSHNYHGADYGVSYAYDSLARKATTVIVQNLDTERLAIEDVLNGPTIFDDIERMAEHWKTCIQRAAY